MYYRNEPERPAAVRFIRRLGLLALLLAVLAAGVFFGLALQGEYRPEPMEALDIKGEPGQGAAQLNTAYKVITYNLGFCALDAERDFFMEGGKSAGADSREAVERNLSSVLQVLRGRYDFILLQEVDVASRRSFEVDARAALEESFGGTYTGAFAVDEQAFFVPLPPGSPMGKTRAGVQIFSNVLMESAYRHRLAGTENPLVRPFMPGSCFVAVTVPVEGGRNLRLINVHLSSYESDSVLRTRQMEELRAYLDAIDPADYVIVGGDWSQALPNARANPNGWTDETPSWAAKVSSDFAPEGYVWGVDAGSPTRRAASGPYREGKSHVTVTDGFLVSSNVEILSVNTQRLNFRNSHHNPVVLQFSLKE